MKLKIGVIFGGKSVEHEISVITALQAMDNIDNERYEVVPIYITKDLNWYTGGMLRHIDSFKDFDLIKRYAKKIRLTNKGGRYVLESVGIFKREINEIHLAFPMVHGANCEDGTIQGYLQTLGIPYTGNNIYASAVGQDKVFMKQILDNNKIPLIKYKWFLRDEYIDDKEKLFKNLDELKYPLILKPACLGSSIGIETVERKEELSSIIDKIITYDEKIIVEEKLTNFIEYNCSVLKHKGKILTSEIEEIIFDDVITYEEKIGLTSDNVKREYPAKISKELEKEIRKISVDTFRLLNNSGVIRVDFIYDKNNKKLYLNEVNTIPNCFSHHLWEEHNISYRELLDILIKDAINNVNKKEQMTLTLDSDLLMKLKNKDIKEVK